MTYRFWASGTAFVLNSLGFASNFAPVNFLQPFLNRCELPQHALGQSCGADRLRLGGGLARDTTWRYELLCDRGSHFGRRIFRWERGQHWWWRSCKILRQFGRKGDPRTEKGLWGVGRTCGPQQKDWRSTSVSIWVTVIFAEKVLKPSRNSNVISPFSSKNRLEGNMLLWAVLPASTIYTFATRARNISAKPWSASLLPCPTNSTKNY